MLLEVGQQLGAGRCTECRDCADHGLRGQPGIPGRLGSQPGLGVGTQTDAGAGGEGFRKVSIRR